MSTITLVSEDHVHGLLDRVIARDERSLCELYRAFGRRIYAFALTRLRDAHEAEQVVVDTMYEVWRQAHRFNRACRFSTWLLGIANNKILHMLRARAPQHEDLDDVEHLLAGDDDPCRSASEQEHRRDFLRCLAQLPEQQRECMRMALLEGLSLAEIARIQGCPENTVKTRLFKARHKLKRSLAPLLGDAVGVAAAREPLRKAA